MIGGLEKVVAMIEERFGRRSTTGLMFLIGLAIASYCLYAIFHYLVLPVHGFLSPYLQAPQITVATVFYVTAFIAAAIVLFPLAFAFLSRRKVSQSALDRLSELREEGINTVYAAPVRNEVEFNDWKIKKTEWENKIRGHIKDRFPKSDYVFARNLGSVPLQNNLAALNPEHTWQLSYVVRQLDIVEQILNSYRG